VSLRIHLSGAPPRPMAALTSKKALRFLLSSQNGPILAVVDSRLRTFSLCLAVACGSRHDPAEFGGMAHMLEHLLFSASLHGGPPLAERAQHMGGQANAETGLEEMHFYARIGADDANEVASLLLDAVLSAEFSQQRLDREREVVLKELAGAAADPNDSVQDAILAALFQAHPLGRPVGGSNAEVCNLNLSEISEHYENEFLKRAMALVVVGPRELGPVSEKISQNWPTCSRRPDHEPLGDITSAAPHWPNEFSWSCMGARSPALGDPDEAAFRVLAGLLGGSPGSLLYRQLRDERGLAYGFHAWNRGYSEAGAWRVLIGVGQGTGEESVDVVRTLLARIARDLLPARELNAAKRQVEMELVFGIEDPMEFARLIAKGTRSGTITWSFQNEIADLREVSAGAVASAAEQVLAGLVTVVRPQG
jgi:predicted Zn-dependent peptidase